MLIEATTPSKLSHFSSLSKFDILLESPSFAVTMNLDRSHKCTASTTSACVNMAMPMSGSSSQTCSIIYRSPLSSIIRSSASTEDSPLALTHLTTSEASTASKKCLMRAQCAICYGATPMIGVDGESVQEVQDTHLDRTSQRPSTTTMA